MGSNNVDDGEVKDVVDGSDESSNDEDFMPSSLKEHNDSESLCDSDVTKAEFILGNVMQISWTI